VSEMETLHLLDNSGVEQLLRCLETNMEDYILCTLHVGRRSRVDAELCWSCIGLHTLPVSSFAVEAHFIFYSTLLA
jgi:hypothetical protein